MDITLLTRLQNWFLINCDGDWEHSYGISISTLDNPGWAVKIDLNDTCLKNLVYNYTLDNGSLDWVTIEVIDHVFQGYGDLKKLTVILTIFLDEIIPKYADPDFQYEVYVPLDGGPTKIWRPAKAILLTEEILQIIHLPESNYQDIRTITLDDLTFNKEEIFNYTTRFSVGDKIKVALQETFNGVTLIAKE